MPDLSPEIQGKYRQFVRVLMSYVDFQQAAAIAGCILESDLPERYPQDRFQLQGLNSGMIVAYWRPFAHERAAGATIPPLPNRFLNILTAEEREMHQVLGEDRNRVVAHSDSEVWNPRPHYIELRGNRILVPLFSSPHANLLRPAVEMVMGMCTKLQDECFAERTRLEPELESYIPVHKVDIEQYRKMAKNLGMELPE